MYVIMVLCIVNLAVKTCVHIYTGLFMKFSSSNETTKKITECMLLLINSAEHSCRVLHEINDLGSGFNKSIFLLNSTTHYSTSLLNREIKKSGKTMVITFCH